MWSCSFLFLPPMSTAIRTIEISFVATVNDVLYISWTQSLPSWSCGFNLELVQLVGRFCVFFLSHAAPGFQLWFYFHLCMRFVHGDLLLRLPCRTWVPPCEGQVLRLCSSLGHRCSGSTRYSGVLLLGHQVIQCLYIGHYGNQSMTISIGLYFPELLPVEPLPWQRILAGYSLQGRKESDTAEATLRQQRKTLFTCGNSAPVRVEHKGGTAAWLLGILTVPSVQWLGLPLAQELWPYENLSLILL